MFTEKEIAAYQSIKAPDGLRQKIKGRHNKPKRILYLFGTVAACLVLVLTGMALFRQTGIVVNGQVLKDSVVFYHTAPLSERSASSVISVPIEYKGSGTARISVSRGWVIIDGQRPAKELEASASKIVWWEIEPMEDDPVFEMVISTKKSVEKLTLEYKEGKITVKKEN